MNFYKNLSWAYLYPIIKSDYTSIEKRFRFDTYGMYGLHCENNVKDVLYVTVKDISQSALNKMHEISNRYITYYSRNEYTVLVFRLPPGTTDSVLKGEIHSIYQKLDIVCSKESAVYAIKTKQIEAKEAARSKINEFYNTSLTSEECLSYSIPLKISDKIEQLC